MTRVESSTPAPDARLLPFPDTAARRLRCALRQLDAAMSDQKAAVAALRGHLAELNGALAGLSDRAESLKGALGGAAAEARKAQLASRELLATAEMMERIARS
jgi:hypothetical protein